MPKGKGYDSEKQRRFMHAAAERGEVSKASVKRRDEEYKGYRKKHGKLPEKAKRKG